MNSCLHKIIVLLLVITVSGCGFHLRRPAALPTNLQELIVLPDAIYTPLQREIANQLALAGCTVVDAGTKGVSSLTILNDSYSDITLSVGSDGQTREKLLIYTLSYQLNDPSGKELREPTMIRLNRVVKYDPNFVLAKGYEEDKLIHDMRIDAVGQVITQLSTLVIPFASGGADPSFNIRD